MLNGKWRAWLAAEGSGRYAPKPQDRLAYRGVCSVGETVVLAEVRGERELVSRYVVKRENGLFRDATDDELAAVHAAIAPHETRKPTQPARSRGAA